MYLTNSIIRRMLGLQPILQGVPEIKSACDAMAKLEKPKRAGCGKCRKKRGHWIPASAAKQLAVVVQGLSEAKKQIILRTLDAKVLKGFIGGGRPKTVILASA